jgi:hypothetical protein
MFWGSSGGDEADRNGECSGGNVRGDRPDFLICSGGDYWERFGDFGEGELADRGSSCRLW